MTIFFQGLKKYLLRLIFAFLFFTTGAIAMLLFLFNFDISVNKEISLSLDIFGLLSLIVTTLLAVYITSELTKKVQDDRSMKDLSVGRLGKIETLMVDKLREVYRNPELDFVKKTLFNFRSIVRNEHELMSQKGLLSTDEDFIKLTKIVDDLWQKLLLTEAGGQGDVTFDTVTNHLVFSEEVKQFIIDSNNKISLNIYNIQSDISMK